VNDQGNHEATPPCDASSNEETTFDPAVLDRVKQFIEEGIPFHKALGIRVQEISTGHVVLRLPFTAALIGDPFRPALHGGVTSMIADTAGGAACFTMLASGYDRISTVDLRVDYLRPGRPEDVLCTARVERMGNRVALTRMEIFNSSLTDKPIALATAVYSVSRNT